MSSVTAESRGDDGLLVQRGVHTARREESALAARRPLVAHDRDGSLPTRGVASSTNEPTSAPAAQHRAAVEGHVPRELGPLRQGVRVDLWHVGHGALGFSPSTPSRRDAARGRELRLIVDKRAAVDGAAHAGVRDVVAFPGESTVDEAAVDTHRRRQFRRPSLRRPNRSSGAGPAYSGRRRARAGPVIRFLVPTPWT